MWHASVVMLECRRPRSAADAAVEWTAQIKVYQDWGQEQA